MRVRRSPLNFLKAVISIGWLNITPPSRRVTRPRSICSTTGRTPSAAMICHICAIFFRARRRFCLRIRAPLKRATKFLLYKGSVPAKSIGLPAVMKTAGASAVSVGRWPIRPYERRLRPIRRMSPCPGRNFSAPAAGHSPLSAVASRVMPICASLNAYALRRRRSSTHRWRPSNRRSRLPPSSSGQSGC